MGVGSLAYSYDADGRRTSMGGSLAAVTLPANVSGNVFNAANEMTAVNGTALSYDANGNLLSDGTNSYAWDARGHLTGISGGATASFVYDAFGRRMKKTVGGTVTQFLYDRLNPVQELNGSGGVAANLLTGLKLDEYFTRTDSSGTITFLADALGSTVGLVNSAGAIGTSYTYQPFGGTTSGGTANGNPYQFTGRENDGTGLYFYRARYYSPTFQRFIAQDPVGFAGGNPNLYAYTRNSPTTLLDPLGLWSITMSWYEGPGGSLSFGQNPDGSSFASIGVGVGAGGSVTYNPNGTSPGYNSGGLVCRNTGGHATIGLVGTIGAGAGLGGVGVGESFPFEFGVDYSSQGSSSVFGSPTDPETELNFPAASGVELGGGANVLTGTYIW